ncbi:tRNA dihydrouridine synthase DusB [Corynebacterium timonense]|uniref:tRNA-dihydrouridine synthase n=1 Tax=Corynebacterium timonense TaxID=441500 RepID=A0A1H1LD93_9CORY|nr:tRNA dihydrouridine synthase DusB [Corynebacterium timonense]SDR71819.1 putative TIM-barrel protein, nifR3 family [Corynebacterium timonense]
MTKTLAPSAHPAAPLRIGGYDLSSPVLLAPMAGVTNMPFRVLCREIEQQLTGTTSGLYVCEMITARALVARNPKTLHMTAFAPSERPRSMQLYTVDPQFTYDAVRMIVEEDIADHIDMNFGCPVPKVTRRGGGAAIPFKRRLYGNIVGAAVKAAEGSGIPVTVKFRIGIDAQHHTHLDAGRIAAEEGAAAVALHARTASQRYSGSADWSEITRLVEHMEGTGLPVIGNGDIFSADDAEAMLRETGCHGVEIGRGCLGRPWIFAQIGAQLRGEDVPPEPTLGEVSAIIYRHAELLSLHDGEEHACRDIRKHTGWYLRGFPVGGEFRRDLARVESLAELRALLDTIADSTVRAEHADDARGRQGSASKVALPEGWLDDPEDDTVPVGAEMENNGG